MHDLGTLEDGHSQGQGINDIGQITGWSNAAGGSEVHAFLYDGVWHDLGTLGGTHSEGFGINNASQVIGWSYTGGDTAMHAFLYDGTMHDLGTLGGTDSGAQGINAFGDITGWSETVDDPPTTHAFLYRIGEGMIDLNTLIDPLSGWQLENALAINDVGQITGYGQYGGQYVRVSSNPDSGTRWLDARRDCTFSRTSPSMAPSPLA